MAETDVGYWDTTVTELMSIFREAQGALVPVMERARVRWHGNTYDDWETIAEALFDSIVVMSITNALPPADAARLQIPKLAMIYGDYSTMSFIEVLTGDKESPSLHRFFQFGSINKPFDTVEYLAIDAAGKVLSEEINSIPADRTEFGFQHRQPSGDLHPMHVLRVGL